jgi:hypothetical protein
MKSTHWILRSLLFLFLIGVTMLPANAGWTPTGAMSTNRGFGSATLLPNGKVLAVGGFSTTNGILATAELYDPVTGMWTPTGSMSYARYQHTATLLPNGKVLIAGGHNPIGNSPVPVTELYDPATGTWMVQGPLSNPRNMHTAILLPNGKVMVAGGQNSIGGLASAELYDPATGLWTWTGSLNTARRSPTAILLFSGKVMIAAGYNAANGMLSSTELYDPVAGTWSGTGSLITARHLHTTTLLPNGKVLVAGGYSASAALSSAELYDPATGLWTATNPLSTPRVDHTATLLANGKVMAAGGYNNNSGSFVYYFSAELYDPATGTWAATDSMSRIFETPTATVLADGKVMLMDSSKSTVEVYSYPPVITSHPASVAINQGRRAAFSVTASGGDLSYQWQKDTVDIPNEHGATLTLDNVQAGDVGSYRVVVSNTTGSVTSNPATLTVYPDADGDGLTDAEEVNTYDTDPAKGDTDGDGLGDYEEVFTYGTNPNLKDTDGDGFLDSYEVLTGKSPLDPLDKPALVAEARTAIEFTFPSALGKTYRIEGSPDLSVWTTEESGIPGNGGVIQRFYSTRNVPKKFFRVEDETPAP